MDGPYLYNWCVEIINMMYLVTPFKLHGYVSDLGTYNQQLIKLLLKIDKLSDKYVMTFRNPIDNALMVYFADPTHAFKNGRTALLHSKLNKSDALCKNNTKVTWDLIETCWKINETDIQNGRPATFRNLTRNAVYPPNNWALQKVPYALQIVEHDMIAKIQTRINDKCPEFVGSEQSLEYLKHIQKFAQIAVSPKLGREYLCVDNLKHKIFADMKAEVKWWLDWKDSAPNSNKCISDITLFGIVSFYQTFPVFAKLFFDTNNMFKQHSFMCPMRISQNGLERFFSEIKSIGGSYGPMYGTMVNKIRKKRHGKLLVGKKSSIGTKKGHYQITIKQYRNKHSART